MAGKKERSVPREEGLTKAGAAKGGKVRSVSVPGEKVFTGVEALGKIPRHPGASCRFAVEPLSLRFDGSRPDPRRKYVQSAALSPSRPAPI